MATLAADTPVKTSLGEFSSVPILDNDIVYEGAMVGEDGAGYGRPLVAGDRFLGHAVEKVDNTGTGHAAGAKNIRLRSGRYRLEATLASVLITDVGQPVYASDDSVLTLVGAGTSARNTYVGQVIRYLTSTTAIVEFRPGEEDEFGNVRERILKSDDYTTLITDGGKIIYVDTTAKTITLETLTEALAGQELTIVNAGGDGLVLISVDPNSGDLLAGGAGVAANADGHKISNTAATARRGDFITVVSNGTTGWNIKNIRGTWASE
ncbi:MAG: hypothetical protein ABII09_03620 [Planctomycetota bacterium]